MGLVLRRRRKPPDGPWLCECAPGEAFGRRTEPPPAQRELCERLLYCGALDWDVPGAWLCKAFSLGPRRLICESTEWRKPRMGLVLRRRRKPPDGKPPWHTFSASHILKQKSLPTEDRQARNDSGKISFPVSIYHWSGTSPSWPAWRPAWRRPAFRRPQRTSRSSACVR